jgi:predicted kinase
VVSDLIGVTDLSDPRIARLTRAPRYDTLFALAEDNLRAGIPVVLVAPFTAERSVDGWNAVVARLGPHAAGVTLVWLHLSEHELLDRLRRRDAARDTDKLSNPAAFLAAVDRDPPAAPHLSVDAGTPVADQVECVVAHLARPGLAIDGTA